MGGYCLGCGEALASGNFCSHGCRLQYLADRKVMRALADPFCKGHAGARRAVLTGSSEGRRPAVRPVEGSGRRDGVFQRDLF
jgi:hypothetical protein